MDLSDGSDVEGDVELDENALLGSDDDEYLSSPTPLANSRTKNIGKGNSNLAEDSDVLDLDFSKDDLDLNESAESSSSGYRVTPVQFRSVAAKSESDNGTTTVE